MKTLLASQNAIVRITLCVSLLLVGIGAWFFAQEHDPFTVNLAKAYKMHWAGKKYINDKGQTRAELGYNGYSGALICDGKYTESLTEWLALYDDWWPKGKPIPWNAHWENCFMTGESDRLDVEIFTARLDECSANNCGKSGLIDQVYDETFQ